MNNKKNKLDEIENKLKKLTKKTKNSEINSKSNMGYAFRLATEMSAAIAVGGILGWYIDKWLGTKPWIFIFGLLIGIASGCINAYKVSKKL